MIDPRKISFIIPTLGQNSNSLIHNLERIRTFSKCSEILVVTCAESDELIHLLGNYEARYLYCEKNGVFNALNTGISSLKPEIEYFVFLGDDDCIVPENFKAMTNQDKIENIDIIFGSVVVKNEQGQRIYTNRSTRFAHKLLLFTPNFIPLPGTLIKKNL